MYFDAKIRTEVYRKIKLTETTITARNNYLEARKVQRLKVVYFHKLDYDVHYLSHNSIH